MSLRSSLAAVSRRLAPASGAAPLADRAGSVAALREEILDQGLTAERAVRLGNALETAGQFLAAIDALTVANRLRRDAAIERRLVRLRNRAVAARDRSLPPPAWPPVVPDDPPGRAPGPPVVQASELTIGLLRNGILRHGCVLVRGLVPPDRVRRLRTAIDRAFDAYDAAHTGAAPAEGSVWYDPLDASNDEQRQWNRLSQSVFTADSPRALFEYLETVYELGIDTLVGGYFGERPALSLEKCTLRRVDATSVPGARRTDAAGTASPWHQDGAFLGPGIRTVNAWYALSTCGRDAAGMDLIPVRLERLITAGGPGAGFDWTVSAEAIARELPGVEVWRPTFEPGDVLFFDHLMLHRTAAAPGMTELRYAVESWFFAPSVYPSSGSTPILV